MNINQKIKNIIEDVCSYSKYMKINSIEIINNIIYYSLIDIDKQYTYIITINMQFKNNKVTSGLKITGGMLPIKYHSDLLNELTNNINNKYLSFMIDQRNDNIEEILKG